MRFEHTGKWGVSADGEHFIGCYENRQNAIEECIKSESCCIGKIYNISFDRSSIPDVTDNINQALYDELYNAVGEYADNWQLTAEQQTDLHCQLSEVILNFIETNHLQPNCFTVKNIEEVNYENIE